MSAGATKGKGNLGSIVSIATANFIWGISFLLMRIAMEACGQKEFLYLSSRFSLATLVMILVFGVIRRQKFSLKGKNVGRYVALIIMEPVYFISETLMLKYSNSVFTGVAMSLGPVFSIVFAAIFLKEIPTVKKWLLMLLPVLGVALMTFVGRSMGTVQPLGIVFMLLTCVAQGAIRTLQRSASREFSTYERTVGGMFSCAVTFTLVNLFTSGFNFGEYAAFGNLSFMIPVVLLVVFASVIANSLSNYASGKLPVMYVAIFGAFCTVVSVVAGVVFLKEPMTWLSALGVILAIVGIILINLPEKQKTVPESGEKQ